MSAAKKHATLSPSAFERWSSCPASIRLSKGKKSFESAAAKEGTLAHDHLEHRLKTGAWREDISEEMREAVQVAVTWVEETIADLKTRNKKVELFLEQRIDLSHLHPDIFGTSDIIIYAHDEKLLIVADYKHGKGIQVEAFEDGKANGQMSVYGLGVLENFAFGVQQVQLTIIQPRGFHESGAIRSCVVKPHEVLEFSADLIEAAKRTEDPNSIPVPGDHCGFCPAKPTCPSLSEKGLEIAQTNFKPIESNDEKLATALKWIDALRNWCDGVEEYALQQLQAGQSVPGYKLVDKKSTRKWKNEDEVTEFFYKKCKLTPLEVFSQKIVSPAQAEKLLTKELKAEMASFVTSVSSGTTIAPESDKRPAVILDPTKLFQPQTN